MTGRAREEGRGENREVSTPKTYGTVHQRLELDALFTGAVFVEKDLAVLRHLKWVGGWSEGERVM